MLGAGARCTRDVRSACVVALVQIVVLPGIGLASKPAISTDITVNVLSTLLADEDAAFVVGGVSVLDLGTLPIDVDVIALDGGLSGDVLFAVDTPAALPGGLTVSPGDVIRYNGVSYSLAFDASASTVPAGVRIDAVHEMGTDLLVSFDTSVALDVPLGDVANDEDIVIISGGLTSLLIDFSALGVPESMDVDGFGMLTLPILGSAFFLSFDTSGTLGGVSFDDEDVLRYVVGTGTWSVDVDGSAIDPDLGPSDVIAVPEASHVLMLLAGIPAVAALTRHRKRRT